MFRPVVALLTDFGTRDHYVGVMKAVALGICPDLTFVDISHDIAPQDTLGAALELGASYAYFPSNTVFLVVVDPGVGSARRVLAAEAGTYRFVAPDNGVLTLALRTTPPTRVVDVTASQYARPVVSRTFEGRDRLAPAAAWLAKGTDLSSLGPPVPAWQELTVPAPIVEGGRIVGEILRVDRFGNLVTNVDRRRFESFARGRRVRVAAGDAVIEGVVSTYVDAEDGALCALWGSSDHLELAVRGGSAGARLTLRRGAVVSVTPVEAREP